LGSNATGASAPLNPAVEILLKFVNEDLLADSQEKVAPDTLLFDKGRIDSLKILRLIAFLEVRSGQKIPDEQIVMDRFRTIETIAKNFPDR
jgi:acyl carrier protein